MFTQKKQKSRLEQLIDEILEPPHDFMNPFSKEHSQHFREVSGDFRTSLAYVFLDEGLKPCFYGKRDEFLKEFEGGEEEEEKGDTSLVYDEIISDFFNKVSIAKWAVFLERPRNKWGDSRLENAIRSFLKNDHFLSVRLHTFTLFLFVYIPAK